MIRIANSLLGFVFTLAFTVVLTAGSVQRDDNIDVVHYAFDLLLSDDTDRIEGIADIDVILREAASRIQLDLIGLGDDAKGMTVSSVSVNDSLAEYSHVGDVLSITFPSALPARSRLTLVVEYAGTPRDGLIISTNKHGDRTFFGDNWPNRARNWLPVIDDPADKATVEFRVVAPIHYQVVANGRLVEESSLEDGTRVTHWHSGVPLATKVMVIGVARFAVDHVGVFHSVPVQSWVYPQEKTNGFHDYEMARPILEYFIDKIGPFPYEKLASVQSKTIYGGMENAGAIFYHENSIDGKRGSESLFAHEIAHQWFGDSVTEQDFHHIWLSEGFATYFTQLFMEHKYGRSNLNEGMQNSRTSVINYAARNPNSPVVDTTITVLTQLLSANSYQKGGWILHMLRREIGDVAFWDGIRSYYSTYRDSNAWTSDLLAVMEHVSEADLNWFFDQWVFTPSVPNLEISWTYDAGSQAVVVDARQSHSSGIIYQLPVEIRFSGDGTGETQTHLIRMSAGSGRYTFQSAFEPSNFQVDPNINLLADITVTENEK